MAEPVTYLAPRVVRDDGSAPFVAPVAGVAPVLPAHLATKAYVDSVGGGGGGGGGGGACVSIDEGAASTTYVMGDLFLEGGGA